MSIRARNLYPMLVLVFLLNVGLYRMMLLRCLFFHLFVVGSSNCSVEVELNRDQNLKKLADGISKDVSFRAGMFYAKELYQT